MAYVLASASLSKLVLAHDCPGADVETLGKAYQLRSEEEIPDGLRWFYCIGLGIALGCMSMSLFWFSHSCAYPASSYCKPADCVGLISMSHVHKEFDGQRIAKKYRLAVRIAVAIILICLPLTHALNSLQLISTTTGLIVFTLIVDLYGSTSVQDRFWKDKSICKYSADCHMKKKDVESAIKTGQVIEVEELSKGIKGEKGVYA